MFNSFGISLLTNLNKSNNIINLFSIIKYHGLYINNNYAPICICLCNIFQLFLRIINFPQINLEIISFICHINFFLNYSEIFSSIVLFIYNYFLYGCVLIFIQLYNFVLFYLYYFYLSFSIGNFLLFSFCF